MTDRSTYQQKREADIRLIEAELEKMKARAERAEADAKILYQGQVEALQERLDAARTKLKELGEASEDAWDSVRSGTEKAVDELKAGFEKAKRKLDSA